MTIERLGRILGNAYCDARTGLKMRNVHIFGIRYCDELSGTAKRMGLAKTPFLKRLATTAGLDESIYSEIGKGMILGNCVGLTNDAIRMLEEADRQLLE